MTMMMMDDANNDGNDDHDDNAVGDDDETVNKGMKARAREARDVPSRTVV